MSEKTKEEELKQKLFDFFDKKLTDLTTKFQNDIDSIEKFKYECFEDVIKKLEEIEEEHKKEEGQEKQELEKEKHEETKHEKVSAKKKIEKVDPLARPKTPMPTTKKKGKEDKGHDTSEVHKKDAKGKTGGAHPPAGGKGSKKADTSKKPTTAKADPKAKTGTKKGAPNAKKAGAGGAKGGKKDAKKGGDKEKKEEEKKEEEPVVEEKKPIILSPKYIYTLSEELKNNSGLSCLYFVLKGKYLDKKNTLHITTYSPLLYKNMGSMKYLLDDKKKEVQAKADEIEKFLNNYGVLNTYLTKEFSLTKKAIQSVQFFKKKEEEEILKMAEIPKEVGMMLKCIYYIIDESFDENTGNKELLENLINNILTKNEDKTFKSLFVNYISQHKYLNLTKEKYDKINNIINENNIILNMITMTKMCRPMSLFCFFLKEVHDYINLKTLDGQFYFDLRMKNNELQKYKDLIYLIENDGKKREPPKEEKKEEPLKTEEPPKTEEAPKAEEPPKIEEAPKAEEPPKTEEAPKAEEPPKTEEAPKTEEPPKTEEAPKAEEPPKTEEPPSTEVVEQPQA